MNKFNRFDMEQQIMTCWSICEDLDTLMEGVMEHDMSQDRITNALLGMKELYQLKFDKLWDQFESMCREYCELTKIADSYKIEQDQKKVAAMTAKEPTKSQVKRYESQGADWPFGGTEP